MGLSNQGSLQSPKQLIPSNPISYCWSYISYHQFYLLKSPFRRGSSMLNNICTSYCHQRIEIGRLQRGWIRPANKSNGSAASCVRRQERQVVKWDFSAELGKYQLLHPKNWSNMTNKHQIKPSSIPRESVKKWWLNSLQSLFDGHIRDRSYGSHQRKNKLSSKSGWGASDKFGDVSWWKLQRLVKREFQ